MSTAAPSFDTAEYEAYGDVNDRDKVPPGAPRKTDRVVVSHTEGDVCAAKRKLWF